MPAGISVIICCYNSAERIRPTLEHLCLQQEMLMSEWEVILIDNASTDSTAATATEIWNNLPGEQPAFKIIAEPVPGLSAARKAGIEAAVFDYVLFCDDDNWLDKNYLANGLKIMRSNPAIGALGGTGNPVFETTEPPYFWESQYHVLAVGKQSSIEGDITEERGVLYGAGMILNKMAYLDLRKNYSFEFLVSDRIGNLLISSGDHELCLALIRIGYRIYYSQTLQFQHYIPQNRTSIGYYKRLFLGFGVSYALLHVYRIKKGELNSQQNDYRYICSRSLKTIIALRLKLLLSGFPFRADKYKFVDDLHRLYSNIGIFMTLIKTKNKFKQQFIEERLFREGSNTNNS
ncbi:MAG: glycosyltransferase [Bacteroidota bacterium]